MIRHRLTGILLLSATPLFAAYGQQEPPRTFRFDLPAEDLGTALRAVTARAGWELYAPADAVNQVAVPELHGDLTAKQAVERLLAGTGLAARFASGAVMIRGRGHAAAEAAIAEEIVVTGTNIRNAPVTGSLITVRQQDIENAGQANLGETVRSLPSNFNGGQNPTVGSGAGGAVNSNVNSASSINLRGLGPDATLTLLNGRRLPYDSAFQGVDISAIPVAAVDRIDIFTDGASALYGSDAVAGVANVVLKRDFDGIVTTGRVGGATSGGDFEQEASAVGGTRWSTGGFIATYDFDHVSAVHAADRGYADALPPKVTLYPSQHRNAGTFSLHQDIAPTLSFSIDTLYNKRWSTIIGGSVSSDGTAYQVTPATVATFAIAPELDLTLGRWRMRAFGTVGTDTTRFRSTYRFADYAPTVTSGCYCSHAASAELSGDGPLFMMPGGTARLALGGGFRENRLNYSRLESDTDPERLAISQKIGYFFGEASLPLLSPDQQVPLLRRLTLSAAVRHERYQGAKKVTTPKLGLIAEAVDGLTLRASWGKSFRAPTLYERYAATSAYLLPAQAYGIGPAGTSVLYVSGGDPDLRPERSTNWSAAIDLKSRILPGFTFSADYFHIDYRDRVGPAITGSVSTAFSSPAYGLVLTQDPSASAQQALIAAASGGLVNLSGGDYSPGSVVYLIDNRSRNISREHIGGVDVQMAYRWPLATATELTLTASGTYLTSNRRLLPTLPATELAGTIFNSPRFRARGGASLSMPKLTLSSFINIVGALQDRRYLPIDRLPGQASVDVIARYQLTGKQDHGRGVELSLIADNLFDAKPHLIRVTGPSDTPYDSTNFSAIGRFLAISVTRRW